MLLLLMLSAVSGPTDGKPMAMDDWQQLSILEVAAAQAPNGTHHVRAAAGDLDGDGAADEVILALDCAVDGSLTAARYIIAPRDSATGMASGKREVKQKMWSPANFRLQQIKPTYDIKTIKGTRTATYDVKKVEGTRARTMAVDDWQAITLGSADGLCPATVDAARKATKTRSNIQNN